MSRLRTDEQPRPISSLSSAVGDHVDAGPPCSGGVAHPGSPLREPVDQLRGDALLAVPAVRVRRDLVANERAEGVAAGPCLRGGEFHAHAAAPFLSTSRRSALSGPEVVDVAGPRPAPQTELLLDERHQLHGEQRVDEAEGEDVLVVLQVVVLEEDGEEFLDLLSDLVARHGLINLH